MTERMGNSAFADKIEDAPRGGDLAAQHNAKTDKLEDDVETNTTAKDLAALAVEGLTKVIKMAHPEGTSVQAHAAESNSVKIATPPL